MMIASYALDDVMNKSFYYGIYRFYNRVVVGLKRKIAMWTLKLLLLESTICLPVTGGAGLLFGILLAVFTKKPKFWWIGLLTGLLIGFAICVFFIILNPCGGFIGC
jgi:peptidoglycan/LPS O-acetylase OafA/YrhL